MAYATLSDLRTLLPENITIGNVTTPTVVSPKRDTITIRDAQRFLYYATQYVDGRLHPYYLTPLKRIIKEKQPVLANMLPGSTVVKVEDANRFLAGAAIRLKDTNGSEHGVINEIPETFSGNFNLNWLNLVNPTVNAYDSGSDAYMEMLVYPDPIPLMTARFAVSMLYDKLFSTDGSPDVSNYGKAMRNEAKNDMDSILSGQIRLEGQEYTGRRFVRIQLFDTHKTTAEVQLGQGKE